MTITLTKPKTQVVWRSPDAGDKTTSIPGSAVGNKGYALQIKSTLAGGPPVYDAEALAGLAALTDDAERIARLAERGSDEYWTLKLLERNKGGVVEGVVVFRDRRRVEVELCETLHNVSVAPRPDHELGQRLRLLVEAVNPRAASIHLRQLE